MDNHNTEGWGRGESMESVLILVLMDNHNTEYDHKRQHLNRES